MNHPTERRDVYAIVTNRIIEQLEKGVVPWRKPWKEAGVPQNLITKRPYRGINVWLLLLMNYRQNFFLTFKQAIDLGGRVIKGERGHIVVFWTWIEKPIKDEDGKEEIKKIPFLRYYTVFNVSQCEGLPNDKVPSLEVRKNDPIRTCEDIVRNMPNRPEIRHLEQRAYYFPQQDYVNMPIIESFEDSESYYGTLFHELIHSTGHTGRLNRKELMEINPFGTKTYSMEELTAEIGSCYLASFAGIAKEDMGNNIAYIQCWLRRLKDDTRFIIYGSSQAQRAVDYILCLTPDNKDEVVLPKAQDETKEHVL